MTKIHPPLPLTKYTPTPPPYKIYSVPTSLGHDPGLDRADKTRTQVSHGHTCDVIKYCSLSHWLFLYHVTLILTSDWIIARLAHSTTCEVCIHRWWRANHKEYKETKMLIILLRETLIDSLL